MNLDTALACFVGFLGVVGGATASEGLLCQLWSRKALKIGIWICIGLFVPLVALAVWVFGGYGSGGTLANILHGIEFLGWFCLPCGTMMLINTLILTERKTQLWRNIAIALIIASMAMFVAFVATGLQIIAILTFFVGGVDFATACRILWKSFDPADSRRPQTNPSKKKITRRTFFALGAACLLGYVASMESDDLGYWKRQIFGVDLSFERDDSLEPLAASGNAWAMKGGYIQVQLTGGSIAGRAITQAHINYLIGGRRRRPHVNLNLSINPGSDETITPDMPKMQWKIYGEYWQDVSEASIQVRRNGRWDQESIEQA